jgi:hypothetical protein
MGDNKQVPTNSKQKWKDLFAKLQLGTNLVRLTIAIIGGFSAGYATIDGVRDEFVRHGVVADSALTVAHQAKDSIEARTELLYATVSRVDKQDSVLFGLSDSVKHLYAPTRDHVAVR